MEKYVSKYYSTGFQNPILDVKLHNSVTEPNIQQNYQNNT